MKKLIAFVLAFTMAAAMAVPALADDGSTTDTTNNTNVTGEGLGASIPVHGTYQGPQDVISVDVVWDAMDFIYTDDNKGTWNPTTHQYDHPTEKGWSWKKPEGETKDAPEITLTNHSNVGVKAAFDFNSAIEGLTGNFTGLTDNAFTLPTAVNTALADAPSKTTAFSLSGDGITGNDVELGNITVTISKDDTTPDTPTDPGVVYNSFDELQSAINTAEEGTTITLGANIDGDGALHIFNDDNIVLDLNGHTLNSTFGNSVIWNEGTLTIKNGTVIGSDRSNAINNAKSLTAENLTVNNENGAAIESGKNTTTNLKSCTLYSGTNANDAALVLNADARIVDCKVTKATSSEPNANADNIAIVIFEDSDTSAPHTLTIGGNTTVNQYIAAYGTNGICYLVVEADSAFAPASHIDTSAYSIAQDTETGTWTITRKPEM